MRSSGDRLYLFLLILYSLKKETRLEFDALLKTHVLDRTFYKLMSESSVPAWFKEEFSYDPLMNSVGEMRMLIREACRHELIRMDGTRFDYHLDDVDEDFFQMLSVRAHMSLQQIQAIAECFQELIDKEKENRGPL